MLALALAPAFAASDADAMAKWLEFKAKFEKTYGTAEEESDRFGVFVENLARAERLEASDAGTATYGVTRFSDLTEGEFGRLMLRHAPRTDEQKARTPAWDGACTACKRFPELNATVTAGSAIDWTTMGAVTDVKDQGQCGSCWSFGTTGDVEGVHFLAGNDLVSLSEAQLVQCDEGTKISGGTGNLGCNGGLQEDAFDYLINDAPGGLVSEAFYPYPESVYRGTTGECSKTDAELKSNVQATISSWSQVSSRASQEDNILPALTKSGPLTIGINAGNMQLYTGGVADPKSCPASGVDHAVLIVGYGTDAGSPYWKIKNSWGTSWGEDGYYRIVEGSNACGVATDVVHSAA